MSQTLDSIDIVKGIAVILMVFGHTEQSARHCGLWQSMPGVTRGIAFAEAVNYGRHMPAFFFSAGLFLAGSEKWRGAFSFGMDEVRTVLYPYLLWGFIGASTEPLTSQFRMAGHTDLSAMFTDSGFLRHHRPCPTLAVTEQVPHRMAFPWACFRKELASASGSTSRRVPPPHLTAASASEV